MSFDLPWILWLAPAVGLGFWGLAWIARRRRIQAASAWSAGAAAAGWNAKGIVSSIAVNVSPHQFDDPLLSDCGRQHRAALARRACLGRFGHAPIVLRADQAALR